MRESASCFGDCVVALINVDDLYKKIGKIRIIQFSQSLQRDAADSRLFVFHSFEQSRAGNLGIEARESLRCFQSNTPKLIARSSLGKCASRGLVYARIKLDDRPQTARHIRVMKQLISEFIVATVEFDLFNNVVASIE